MVAVSEAVDFIARSGINQAAVYQLHINTFITDLCFLNINWPGRNAVLWRHV